MTERHVAILGEVRVDEVRDQGGVRESVTGPAVELARALRGHGLVLTIIAPVGEDPDGERIRDALESSGVRLVAIPATTGTPRRSLVRDQTGAETERTRTQAAFTDTRRSLAAQAEADVIVDLRGERRATVQDDRDEVLRALGLLEAAELPADQAGQVVADQESPSAEVPGPARMPGPATPDRSRLLPSPLVAGTVRNAPVRLLPPAPVAHTAAPDWLGLEAQIARVAT